MKKEIHNNLIIENLIRTEYFKQLDRDEKQEIVISSEWFNQFNRNQQEEILEGLKYNLDVSWYANPEFNWMKMNRMREELLKKQIG